MPWNNKSLTSHLLTRAHNAKHYIIDMTMMMLLISERWFSTDVSADYSLYIITSVRFQNILSCVKNCSTAEETSFQLKHILCIGIIMFSNFTIINCGLSCSTFWSVLFHCCEFCKTVRILHPNCCLVF